MTVASVIMTAIADMNHASDHSLLWGRSVEFWDRLGIWALIIGAILGVVALLLTAASAYVLYRVADKAQVDLAAESKAGAERISINERETARATAEAARLRLELDREIQKRAPRFLTEDQKAAMLSELKGKIPEIAVVVQNDLEAQAFSIQFVILLQEAGAKPIYVPEPPREDRWFAPAGVIMYSPAGSNISDLKDDPLYRALKSANLFGGTTNRPYISAQIRGPSGPTVIPGYTGCVLYVGQKSPF